MIPESPRAIRAVLAELRIRPSRRLGQNFLADANVRDAIVREAGVQPGDLVLEVGPGLGTLTKGLLDTGAEVLAVERDPRLAAYVTGCLGPTGRLTVLNRDILEQKELAPEVRERLDRPFLTVSNLPYSVASPLTASLFRHEMPPDRALLMVQKEAGERMTGVPGTGDYGPLAVLLSLCARVEIARDVPPQIFVPAPKVRSVVIRITPRSLNRADLLAAEKISREAFLHRRKTIRKSLAVAGYGASRLEATLREVGIEPGDRPESVAPELYLELGRRLSSGAGDSA